MNLSYTSRFSRSYRDLSEEQQGQIDKAIREYVKNPGRPPGRLNVHKLNGVKGESQHGGAPLAILEMHAGGKGGELVITFQREKNDILFRNCGKHDITIKNP